MFPLCFGHIWNRKVPLNFLVLLVNMSYILKKLVFPSTVKAGNTFDVNGQSFSKNFAPMASSYTKISLLMFVDIAQTWRLSHCIYLLSGVQGVYHKSIHVFLYIQLHHFTTLSSHVHLSAFEAFTSSTSNFFKDIWSVTICLCMFCLSLVGLVGVQ